MVDGNKVNGKVSGESGMSFPWGNEQAAAIVLCAVSGDAAPTLNSWLLNTELKSLYIAKIVLL